MDAKSHERPGRLRWSLRAGMGSAVRLCGCLIAAFLFWCGPSAQAANSHPDPVKQYLAAEDFARAKSLRAEREAVAATNVAELDRAIVEETRQRVQPPVVPPTPPEPVHATQILLAPGLLLGGLLGGWLASVLAAYFNRKFDPWAPASASRRAGNDSTLCLLDEPSVLEFFRALHTGKPVPLAGTAAGAAGLLATDPSQTSGPPSGAAAERMRDFYNSAPRQLADLRALFSEINCAPDETARQKRLLELFEQTGTLRKQAELPELLPVWQVLFALEGLLQRLSMKAADATPSALRTAAGALDLLVYLCGRRPRRDLLTEPPVRLLAVDDDPISRRAMSLALAKLFEEPDLAQDGQAALALAGQQAYDVIFLDVEMPGMDGFELCTKIHETALNQNTPVVFVTRHGDFDSRAKCSLSGGYSLLAKPFLVFEVALKALTLVLRGRLHKPGADACPGAAAMEATLPAMQVESSIASTGLAAAAPQSDAGTRPLDPVSSFVEKPPANGEKQAAAPDLSSGTDIEEGEEEDLSKLFIARTPKHLQQIRKQLQSLAEAADARSRMETLSELYLGINALVDEADRAELHWAFRLGSSLRSLLQRLVKDHKRATPSALKAANAAVDSLEALCRVGLEPVLVMPDIRILVVDDDPLARRMIASAVQLAFVKPDHAENGEAALALANEKEFDMIFMDVLMPGLDGFSASTRIHETNLNRRTPIIFVSSNASADDVARAVLAGGSGLIPKGAMPVEITLTALAFVLGSRIKKLEPVPVTVASAEAQVCANEQSHADSHEKASVSQV